MVADIDDITPKKPECSYTLQLKSEKPAGYALAAAEGGQTVPVAQKGFFTDYDGDIFYKILESTSAEFLQPWMNDKTERGSMIRNFLIFRDKENHAEVYINFDTIASVVSKRISKDGIRKGERVSSEDIGDIREISFPEITLRKDCGVIYFFTLGWRRGVYFDYLPLQPDSTYQCQNLEMVFAAIHTVLLHPNLYRKYPKIKDAMFERGWFPFIRLLGWRINEIIEGLSNGFKLDKIEEKIVNSFDKEDINTMYNGWLTKQNFKGQETFIRKAIDEYFEGDYISAIHILYPHIEGLMQQLCFNGEDVGKSKTIVHKLTETAKINCSGQNLFLPDEFEEYLNIIFFPKIDFSTVPLTRHTVTHGIADGEKFTRVKAFQAILILDQMYFYL